MYCIAINNIMKILLYQLLGNNIYFLKMLFYKNNNTRYNNVLMCNKMTLQETTRSRIYYFVKKK